jgi:hypothetical protein
MAHHATRYKDVGKLWKYILKIKPNVKYLWVNDIRNKPSSTKRYTITITANCN